MFISVIRYGPIGAKLSKAFDRAKCQSLSLILSAVISLPIVCPSIYEFASDTDTSEHSFPIIIATSTSTQTFSTIFGILIFELWEHIDVGDFKKTIGSG